VGARERLQSVDVVLPVTLTGIDVPSGQGVQVPLPAVSLYEPDKHCEQVTKPPATLPPKPAEHVQSVLPSQVKPLNDGKLNWPPMDLALLEIDTLLRGSPENASEARDNEELIAKVTEDRLEHWKNACMPMLVTDEGMVIDFSDVHPLNAASKMVVTDEGMVIDFRDEQEVNA